MDAHEQTPANTGPSPALPVDELERLRLQNIHLQRERLRQQLDLLTLQFLRGPEPRALQARIDSLARDLDASAAALFARHGLDPREHQFDIEAGLFVRRSA